MVSQLSSVPNIAEVGRKAEHPEYLQTELGRLLGRDAFKFPGAQPISFAREHLAELRARDYYVCEKSDGIRSLLWFTKNEHDEERHFLIDRKNDYYFVEGLHFPKPAGPGNPPGSKAPPPEIDWGSFHSETLLDGELLIDTSPDGTRVLKYLVFDCLYMDGKRLLERTLDKRLAYFMENIHEPYTALCKKFPEDAEYFPFRLEKKSFQFAYGTQMMFMDVLPRLMHGSDGLIFTCRETDYQFGTDPHILKWKPAEENTIDFKLELTFPPMTPVVDDAMDDWQYDYNAHPTFTLHAHFGEGDDRPYGTLHVTPEEWATMKKHSEDVQDGLDGAIVECHQDSEGQWRFNRFRGDKADANHITVVEKVLKSIEDGVTKEELIGAAGDIRKAWKIRAEMEKEKERAKRMAVKRKAQGGEEGDAKKGKVDSAPTSDA